LITLSVGKDARRRAAGAIVPLLVPDLPVFVWRPGALAWDDELLGRLLDVADRFIIDSASCTDATAVLSDLAGRKRDDRWSPGDFAWSRLAPWREAVAALFDAPDTAHLPARLERVVVRYGAGGDRSGAALLGAWAADRIEVARERGAVGLGARVADGDGAGEPGAAELVLTAVADVRRG
jgi:glucose-6-phosphate dehydrogenase assembly protein OpcA